MNKLPHWFRQEIPDANVLDFMHFLSKEGINTVCQQAKCPNLSVCFSNKKATFMILGKRCTRSCRFCNVWVSSEAKDVFKGKADILKELLSIKDIVRDLGLNYVVITSVTRDDLNDGGAEFFAEAVRILKESNPQLKIEVLIPDFLGKKEAINTVISANPEVIAHNMETVRRLYDELRPQADYSRSLDVIREIRSQNKNIVTKSSVMLGLGETKGEVVDLMYDLRDNHCDYLTLGQYLAPSSKHYPVKEYIGIEQFDEYKDMALDIGFKKVLSGPKIRSSYLAEELFENELSCV